ncbi:hypothetical protein HY605_02985 [Candidatus Peregrinibacteria bacterium]|nr:hypothetical protein [Candidatus Peregrinibacteria bacterium]
MEKKVKKPKKKAPIDLFSESRISIFLQSTFITIVAVGLIGGGAYALDKYLGTFPILFIIGLVMAYPLTQIYLYKKFKNYAKNKLKNG